MSDNDAPLHRAVLFDIDDTLLKTSEPKWRQHKWVAQHYYGIELSDEELRANWGKPFDELASALYQNQGTAMERRANFIRHELEFPKQYEPGALEMMEALHGAGIALGLMTSMYMDGAKIDLDNLHFPLDYFVVRQGAEATKHHKPDGRVFAPALSTLKGFGILAGIAYVGEALSDFRAARAAGIDFIGVTQGFVDEAGFRAAGAKTVFKNLDEIKDFVLGI